LLKEQAPDYNQRMESDPTDKLEQLLSLRQKASRRDKMGIIYAFWGLYNTLGVWVFHLVWYNALFWLFWIPFGIVIQTILVSVQKTSGQGPIWDRIFVAKVWVSSLVLLPFLVYIFPFLFHLYPTDLIFPVALLWVGVTLYVAGVFSRQIQVSLAALLWVAMAPVILVFPGHAVWLFTALNVVGLALPGLWSLREERR